MQNAVYTVMIDGSVHIYLKVDMFLLFCKES